MSAFGGKADLIQGVSECPLIAKSGHLHPDKTFIGRVEKGFDFLGYHFGPDGLSVPADDGLRTRQGPVPVTFTKSITVTAKQIAAQAIDGDLQDEFDLRSLLRVGIALNTGHQQRHGHHKNATDTAHRLFLLG